MGDKPADFDPERDLMLTRHFDATPAQVYEAWRDPDLMRQWFAPLPWTIARVESDFRPGGRSLVVMRSPEGEEFPNPGLYLEVVPNEKIVFTDAYTSAWIPSPKPFMTVTATFEPEDGGTRYTAIVRHWTAEDRRSHEEMGFHEGWGQCADQLEALLAAS